MTVGVAVAEAPKPGTEPLLLRMARVRIAATASRTPTAAQMTLYKQVFDAIAQQAPGIAKPILDAAVAKKTITHAQADRILAMIGAMEVDPTLGLYSPTAATQSPLAQDAFMAGVSDIVQGRRPIAEIDTLLTDWRSKAGDKMRAEFQDALAQAKKVGS